jgi:hypothetical protein
MKPLEVVQFIESNYALFKIAAFQPVLDSGGDGHLNPHFLLSFLSGFVRNQ